MRKVISILLILSSCLFTSVASAEPGRRDLYNFLVRSIPSATGAEDFFKKLEEDSQLREYWDAIIESDSRLRKAAQQGLAFRKWYREANEKRFNQNGFLQALADNPSDTIRRSYIAFMISQKERQDKTISWTTADLRAYEATLERFSRPRAASQSEFTNDSTMEDFYARQLHQREQDTESRILRADEIPPYKLEGWKKVMLKHIQETRVNGIRELFLNLAKTRGNLKLYPHEADRPYQKFITWPRAHLNRDNLATAEFRIIGAQDSAEDIHPDRAALSKSFIRERISGIQNEFRFANWLFGWALHPLKYKDYEKLAKATPSSSEYLEIKLPAKDKTPAQTIVLPLDDIRSILALPGLTQKQRKGNVEWVGTDPRFHYHQALAAQDNALAEAQAFLSSKKGEPNSNFEHRLRTHHPTLAFPPEKSNTPSDFVTGLKWHGYAQSIDHWKARDAYNTKRTFDPESGLEKAEKWKTGKWTADWFTRQNSYVRAAILTTLLTGTLVTVGYTVYQLQKSFDEGGRFHPRTIKQVPAMPPPQAYELTKHSLTDSKQEAPEGPLYRLLPASNRSLRSGYGSTREYPTLFDLASVDTSGMRGLSPQAPVYYDESRSEFILDSAVPHFMGEIQEVLLPTADGHELSFVELRTAGGTILKPGTDYEVRQDYLSKLYYLQLLDVSKWNVDSAFDFRLGYRAGNSQEKPDTELFLNLKPERLIQIVADLKQNGQPVLAEKIRNAVDRSKTSLQPLTALNVIKAIQESLGKIPESETGETDSQNDKPVEGIAKLKPFQQPDGRVSPVIANELMAQIFRDYYRSERDVSVLVQPTIIRDDKNILAIENIFLRTVLATRDGKHRWTLPPINPGGTGVKKDKPKKPGLSRIPWYLYSEKRKSPKELLEIGEDIPSEPIELGPSQTLPDPRRDLYQTLRQGVVKSMILAQLTPQLAAHRGTPLNETWRLANILLAFSQGDASAQDLRIVLEDIFPDIKLPEYLTASEIRSFLEQVVAHQNNTIGKFYDQIVKGKMEKFSPLLNLHLTEKLGELIRFIVETDWEQGSEDPFRHHSRPFLLPEHKKEVKDWEEDAPIKTSVTPETHAEREAQYGELKTKLYNKDFRAAIPRKMELPIWLPVRQVRRLGDALISYESGETTHTQLLQSIREIYPDFAERSDEWPSKLKDLLKELQADQKRAIAYFGKSERINPKYAIFYSEMMLVPVWELYDFYEKTDWAPVQKPSPVNPMETHPTPNCAKHMAALASKISSP